MKQKRSRPSTDTSFLAGADAALRRAAKRAREIAADTGTPLVISRNGKIVKLRVTAAARSRRTRPGS